MATSRKTSSKDTPPKATAAGPKKRAGGKNDADPTTALAVVAAAQPAASTPEGKAGGKGKGRGKGKAAGEDAAGADTRFKRTDLMDAVSARTSLKKPDAKIVLDLVLEELGRALDGSDDLVLPPLGKLAVKRRKPESDGSGILTLKLRRPGPSGSKGDESPLADPDEDG